VIIFPGVKKNLYIGKIEAVWISSESIAGGGTSRLDFQSLDVSEIDTYEKKLKQDPRGSCFDMLV
jgi:hypothetical protein